MDKHALAILESSETWNWPTPLCLEGQKTIQGRNFKTICRKLLMGFVAESFNLGGTFLDEIWCAIEMCHPQLKENVQELQRIEYSSPDQSELLLFEGVERDVIDFSPVFELAAELFTHIGVAFMNPEGRHHGMSEILTRTPSTGDISAEDLKLLSLKRDGTSCPLTHVAFFGQYDFRPTLAHVIPPSILNKPETLRYITLMAGDKVVDAFMGEALDSINNVMVIEASTASLYYQHRWGVEACNISGDRGTPPKYIFRSIPHDFDHSAGLISLQDGDEIHFGAGPEGDQLNLGPHPLLCNLRLAVACVLHTSGAADLIADLMMDADDAESPHVALKDKDFHDVLNAKLLVSGRALII